MENGGNREFQVMDSSRRPSRLLPWSTRPCTKGGINAEVVFRRRYQRRGPCPLSVTAADRAERGRSPAWQRALQDVLQRGSAAPLRARDALPALLLVRERQGSF